MIQLMIRVLLLYCLFIETVFALATSCSTPQPNNPLFNDAVQTNTQTGKIGIECNSKVKDSPDNQLETSCLGPITAGCTPPVCGTKTCDTTQCIKNPTIYISGTALATFPNFSGGSSVTNPGTLLPGIYDTVTLDHGNHNLTCVSCDNFGVDYRISNLVLSDPVGDIKFSPGNYYIKNITFPGTVDGSRKMVSLNTGGDGSGTVRLFINNGSTPLIVPKKLTMENGGHPERTIIYAFQGLVLNHKDNDLEAYIYSPGDVVIQPTTGDGTATIKGAINAANITLGTDDKQRAEVDYDGTLPTGFGPIGCFTAAILADHFDIAGLPNPASNCTTQSVTITARRSDNTIDTGYGQTVVLSTQGNCTQGSACTGTCTSGGSSCKGTWNVASGSCTGCGGTNGYAEYTFSPSDNGTKTFTLIYPPEGASPTNIVAYQKNNSTFNGTAGSITFNPNQFLVIENTVTPGAPPAPTGYSTAQTAGTAFNPQVKLVAYSACGAGVNTSYTGNKNIQLYSTYVNPTPLNAAGINMKVNGTNIARNSSETATSQVLNFVNGVTTLSSVIYSDVGQLNLNVMDTNATSMTGSSGNFVVKPFDFVISGTNIPGSTSATGTIFAKAGQPFSTTVTVKASDGTTAGSYGKENTPETIKLQSASIAAPSGGRNGSDNLGTIGNATAFTLVSPGVFQGSTFTFDEVGTINLRGRVGDADYLGAGDAVGQTTLVGRFQPDHFDVTGNTPQFATGCTAGQFTYLDQPFLYATAPVITVKAKAANNAISTNYTTQNYNGSFKKLSPSQFAASVQNYLPGSGTTPSIDKTIANLPLPTETTDNLGTMTYTFAASGGGAGEGLRLNRSAAGTTPRSPFNANIQLSLVVSDGDTTPVVYTSNPFVFSGTASAGIAFNSGTQFYHGRLLLQNAYGSEIAPLSMSMLAQYYNGSQFVTNTSDSCTNISNVSNVILTNPPLAQTTITTTASLPQPGFLAGASNIQLSAPNASGQKNVEMNLSAGGANLPWLQYSWPFVSGGAYQNPQAQGNFGVYQGQPSIIYQRENYP